MKLWDTIETGKCCSFFTSTGVEEFFISVTSHPHSRLAEALDTVTANYGSLLRTCQLSADNLVFSRIYLSDIETNQVSLRKSILWGCMEQGAVSLVEQRPIFSGPISLFAYHIRGKEKLRKKVLTAGNGVWSNEVLVTGNHYAMLWNANYDGGNIDSDSYQQTEVAFDKLLASVRRHGMTLLRNGVRTWIFVRDIDTRYHGMVEARRNFFAQQGLTAQSRYLASTGIEGNSPVSNATVVLDSLTIGNLQDGQIVRMQALEHLAPAIKYGVTFERGLRVRFGDRSHIYLSGTASIDSQGEVLYPGDVCRQTHQTLTNIQALLQNQGASGRDIAYWIVYLRNPGDQDIVRHVMSDYFPENIPCLYLQASVCRPAWLVEIEGMGLIEDTSDYPPFL